MGTHRILYQVILVFSVIFYVIYPRWFSWYFIVLVLLIMPFDLIVSLPGMLRRGVLMTAPKTLKQGAKGTLTVITTQKKSYPAGRIKIRLLEKSEGINCVHRLKCGSEPDSRYEMAIDTSRSGYTSFYVRRIWVTSLLGLFSLPVAARCRSGVLVMPSPVKPQRMLSLPRISVLRAEQSGIFSEEHDLRPFRPGDPLKSVHWKLSAKHDSLIVREPLLPPPHSRLIHISGWKGARERNLILGRLVWVSDYLLGRDLHYFVRLGDKGPVVEITHKGQLLDYLYRRLDDRASMLAGTANPHLKFTWVYKIDAKEAAQ